MAIINRYVNPASSAGGDGTTNNTTGATRAYATWAEWQTGEVTDLVAAGNIHQVNLSNGTDASTVDITGWTTSAASYIQINANENYLLAIPLVSNSIALKVDANFTKTLSANILYIQNTNSVTDSNARTNLEISATDCEIDNVIIIGENPSLGTNRIGLYVTGANNTVRNALIYGVGSTAGFPSSARVAGAGTLFVNVTAIGGSDVGYGIRANAADLLTCENCYSGNHGYNDYQGTMTQTKCYSDDSTGTVTGVLVNGTNFQNPATDDYTLPSGSALESAGDGPTVNSNVAAYDWQGLLRSGSTTSIGFDLVGIPTPTAALDDVNTNEIVLDGQTSNALTVSNFGSNITSIKLIAGSSETTAINFAGTGDNYTFDLPDITGYSENTVGCPLGSIAFEVTDGTDTKTLNGNYNVKNGFALVTVASAVTTEGSLFFGISAPADNSLIYIQTADNTTSTASGLLTTDSSTDFTVQIWDIADGTWKQIEVIVSGVNVNATFETIAINSFNPIVTVLVNNNISATLATISLSAFNPTVEVLVDTNISATLETINLNAFNPTVEILVDTNISATFETISILSFNPTVQSGEPIELETFGLSVTISNNYGIDAKISNNFGLSTTIN